MLLVGILLIYFIGSIFVFVVENKKTQQTVALGASALAFLGSFEIFLNFPQTIVHFSSVFFGPGNFCLALDGISISFLFLSCFLVFLCVLFIWEEAKFKEYSICLLLIGFFLVLVFTVQNILAFYVAFEAILIPMYIIIGVWGSRERKIRAVYLFFFYTLVGSLVMLLGILYIQTKVHSLDYSDVYNYKFTSFEVRCLWFAFFIAFASKIPMFPLHIWLPEAHVEAPTVGSVLLAGILLKLGVYGFFRFNLTFFLPACLYFNPLINILGLIGIIYASLSALRQTDLKRIIAYSSIAHMNLIVVGLLSLHFTAVIGAILQSLSHGFVSGGMFFLIGILYSRYHTRFLYYYGGLVHFMPVFSGFFLIFTMANIALPGTSNFIGEFLLLYGIFNLSKMLGFVATLGVILSGAYSLWLYNRIIFGNIKISYTKVFQDLNLREFVILFSLLIFVFILGIAPGIFEERILACVLSPAYSKSFSFF